LCAAERALCPRCCKYASESGKRLSTEARLIERDGQIAVTFDVDEPVRGRAELRGEIAERLHRRPDGLLVEPAGGQPAVVAVPDVAQDHRFSRQLREVRGQHAHRIGVGEQEGGEPELQLAVVADADDVERLANRVQRQALERGQERRVVEDRRAAGHHQLVPAIDADLFQAGVYLDLHSTTPPFLVLRPVAYRLSSARMTLQRPIRCQRTNGQ
jgi:hypothetical protein